MQVMVIIHELWATKEMTKKGTGDVRVKMSCPIAFYTLSREELHKFCECLYGIKVSFGYLTNIRKLVDKKTYRLIGMKSDDCHVMIKCNKKAISPEL